MNIQSGIEQAATLIIAEDLAFEAMLTVLGFPTPPGYQPAGQNEWSNLSTKSPTPLQIMSRVRGQCKQWERAE